VSTLELLLNFLLFRQVLQKMNPNENIAQDGEIGDMHILGNILSIQTKFWHFVVSRHLYICLRYRILYCKYVAITTTILSSCIVSFVCKKFATFCLSFERPQSTQNLSFTL